MQSKVSRNGRQVRQGGRISNSCVLCANPSVSSCIVTANTHFSAVGGTETATRKIRLTHRERFVFITVTVVSPNKGRFDVREKRA